MTGGATAGVTPADSCGKRFDWQLGDLPHGYDHKYIYSHIGYNLKVTDMQAAIRGQTTKKITGLLNRKENFNTLYQGLKKYEKSNTSSCNSTIRSGWFQLTDYCP